MKTYEASTEVNKINNETVKSFQDNFGGPLIEIGNEIYDTERQLWNKLIDKRPGIIAQCTGVSDVIQAVNFARGNDLLFSVRGAGHNVAGNASIDDGLVIDLSHMRTVMVNPKQNSISPLVPVEVPAGTLVVLHGVTGNFYCPWGFWNSCYSFVNSFKGVIL